MCKGNLRKREFILAHGSRGRSPSHWAARGKCGEPEAVRMPSTADTKQRAQNGRGSRLTTAKACPWGHTSFIKVTPPEQHHQTGNQGFKYPSQWRGIPPLNHLSQPGWVDSREGSRLNLGEEFIMCPLVLGTCMSYWVLADLNCIVWVG